MPKIFHEKFQIYGDNHEFIYHVNEPNSGSKYGHVEASDPDITVIIIQLGGSTAFIKTQDQRTREGLVMADHFSLPGQNQL